MKMITPAQLKFIHALLGELNLMEHKAELVFSFTGHRTESCRELTLKEARELIDYLKGSQERTVVIRRIWHLAYEMGIIIPGDRNERSMNAAKLDAFCEQRGTVKKAVSQQTLQEVKRTAKQFEAMYSRHLQKLERRTLLESLKKKLETNIASENYEEAARLKKMIDEQKEQNKSKRKKARKAV